MPMGASEWLVADLINESIYINVCLWQKITNLMENGNVEHSTNSISREPPPTSQPWPSPSPSPPSKWPARNHKTTKSRKAQLLFSNFVYTQTEANSDIYKGQTRALAVGKRDAAPSPSPSPPSSHHITCSFHRIMKSPEQAYAALRQIFYALLMRFTPYQINLSEFVSMSTCPHWLNFNGTVHFTELI